jgi:hypothetical protein
MKKKVVSDENELDDEMVQDAPGDDMWNGNRRRKLWKATCIRAAHDVRTSRARLSATQTDLPSYFSLIYLNQNV